MLKNNIHWLYKREKQKRKGAFSGKEFAAILGVKADTYRSWNDIRGITPKIDVIIKLAAIAMTGVDNFCNLDLSVPGNEIIPTKRDIFWSQYNLAKEKTREVINIELELN